MQVLHAGQQRLILLELDVDIVSAIAKQAGFSCTLEDGSRNLQVDLELVNPQAPLLLFDASDPANLGWFSRCQYYVDGATGAVLQTPLALANRTDKSGHVMPSAVRLQIKKELPEGYQLPGRQAINEQVVYAVLSNFLVALVSRGVGVCGASPVVQPLAGRTESIGTRN